MYTEEKAAKILSKLASKEITASTLARWRKSKHTPGPAYHQVGNSVRYTQEDLEAYITAVRVE